MTHKSLSSSVQRAQASCFGAFMKIGLFTEFSYPEKSKRQAYAEILEQIVLADRLGYDFFSTMPLFAGCEVRQKES